MDLCDLVQRGNEFTVDRVALFDVSKNDDGVVEIGFHGPIAGKIFDFSCFGATFKEGLDLAANSAAA
jgi:hypothetical protein